MKKNVASQIVGAQINSKTDGTAVTSGTTTVYVTLDGGTQATGTVGSGACTHEGHGYWTYAPSQAETNGDLCAFTFENSSGVNVTVQIYTSFPQTGDNYARIGAPVGASISADIAGVQSDTDNIQTRLPTSLVSGRIDASVGAYQSGLTPLQPTTAGRTLDVTATGEAGIDWANIGSPTTTVALSGTTVKTATDVETDTQDIQSRLPAALISGRIDSSVGAMASGVLTATAIAADAITAAKVADGTIDAATFAAGAINAAAIAADAITDAKVASDVTIASVTGSVGSVTGLTASDVGAIKAKTDNLPSDPADESLVIAATDAIYGRLGAPAGASIAADIAGISAGSAPTAAEIADAVWDEPIGDHNTDPLSTGTALSSAGGAGNPWSTVIDGYTAEDLLRILVSVAAGKTTVVKGSNGRATVTFRDVTDSIDLIVASMRQSNREAVVITP